jgi:S-methylmethionine-dependent homocysteine/selenocysteine methylase
VLGQAPFVDLWLAETQSSIAEVGFVRDVLDTHLQAAPLWISYTLMDELVDEDGNDEPRLRSGESIADAARAAEHLGAEVVAFNCSQPEVMEPAVALAAAATSLPIGVYANAFVLHSSGGAANEGLSDLRDDVTPEAYLKWARRWVDAGATVIGGCCGVGPEHVSALSASLSAS